MVTFFVRRVILASTDLQLSPKYRDFENASQFPKTILCLNNENIKKLKDIQLELHTDFIKVVETSRGKKLKNPEKNNIFTG